MPATINEVVAAEIEDKPGSLAEMLKLLKEAHVNVLYTYAFLGFSENKAIMIFRFSNNDKAIKVLQQNGYKLLDSESFGIMESNG